LAGLSHSLSLKVKKASNNIESQTGYTTAAEMATAEAALEAAFVDKVDLSAS